MAMPENIYQGGPTRNIGSWLVPVVVIAAVLLMFYLILLAIQDNLPRGVTPGVGGGPPQQIAPQPTPQLEPQPPQRIEERRRFEIRNEDNNRNGD